MGLACAAGAAAVVAARFDVSDVVFGAGFRYCETASAGAVVENGCEHDGLRFESDLMALVAGLDTFLDAIVTSMLCSS
jgi:hypothetical protein